MNFFRKRLYGERWRAPWSCDPALTRGRLYPEELSPTRSDFQRDRDRIIHSTAFRRLKHKTQVFIYHEGDHYRTRLTHTVEVAQIARSLARALGLDEDLAEALALSHDLGHTPFGHTGEDALHACMEGYGGFDHNAQALRIVTRLEHRYAGFNGLNLTWETLEGLVKHNGPLCNADGNPIGRYVASGVPGAILEYDALHNLELWTFASGEAQVAAIADDIAYDAADLDDGLRAGLFTLNDLRAIPYIAILVDEVYASYPGIEASRAAHELVRRLITRFVEDVITVSEQRISVLRPESASEIRHAKEPVVSFSPVVIQADKDIKAFLFSYMYRHPRVMHVRAGADRIVRDLFERILSEPQLLPAEWQVDLDGTDEARLRRRVADYIAGMTDSYAMDAHKRLFDDTPELR